MEVDYYKLLEIDAKADKASIQKAYHKLYVHSFIINIF